MERSATQRRARAVIFMALGGSILFFGGTLLGYGVANGRGPYASPAPTALAVAQTPAPTPEPAVETGSMGEAAGMKTVLRTRFTSCGHLVESAGPEISGCTQAELLRRYPTAKTEAFSEGFFVTADAPGYCPAHLVLRLREEGLCIEQRDALTLENAQLLRLELDTSLLPAEALSELRSGLPFDDLAAVDAYIEYLES